MPNVYLTNERIIVQIIEWYEKGVDFADAFHLASSHHCLEFYTFDEKFIERSKDLSHTILKQPE